jgi:hypothetical protein
MHICIVGTGAAGWIACNYLKNFDIVSKITIIGSSKIPPIGVGESTTLSMGRFLKDLEAENVSEEDFIRGTDAAIKHGVMYKGWSKKDFLHYFKENSEFSLFDENYSMSFYGRLLANKDKNVHIHEIMGKEIFEESKNNNVLLNQNMYGKAFHFDAGLFINFMSSVALKNHKVRFIDDIVIGGEKTNNKIDSIRLSTESISADFYIFATGDDKINIDFLNIEYFDFSNILLTNKAVVYPVKYKNKRDQFHPYTVAKTMSSGWRWITPTWSRIGTGYVFSTNHISVEDAVKEFKTDVGDQSIEPMVVNFSPKTNRSQINENWCTVGMASGFLEPLDAPGLDQTISSITNQILYYLSYIHLSKNFESKEKSICEVSKLNDRINFYVDFWATFILTQYKTSHRNDTNFWKDQKKVHWETYEKHMDNIDEPSNFFDKMMLYQTIASKDIQWKTSISSKPYKTNCPEYKTINHLKFINNIRNNNY